MKKTALFAFALCAALLFSACGPAAPEPDTSLGERIYMDGKKSGASVTNFHDVTALTGEPTNERGIWGGNQNRIVTVDGVPYFAYLAGEGSGDEGDRRFFFYALKDGNWQLLGGDECTGDAIIPLASADGRVFLVSGTATEYITNTYTVWEYLPGENRLERYEYALWPGISNYNYLAACIDAQSGIIYMLYCGGAAPGYLGYNSFDTNTREFGENRVITIDYRHCYIYMQPNGSGGLIIQGGRDTLGNLIGYDPKPGGEFPYAFDGVRLWDIPDPVLGVPGADITLRAENPADYKGSLDYPIVMSNYTGDCYTDHLGRTHILYTVDAKETDMKSVTYRAVYENGALSVHEKLWDGRASLRLVQDSRNGFWLLKMEYDTNVLRLYKGDQNGGNFELAGEFTLPGISLSYSGMSVAAPRGGTEAEDYIDVVLPSGPGKWHYFRLNFK